MNKAALAGPAAAAGQLPLDDIQGIILRGYGSFGYARHLILRVTAVVAARAVLGRLLDGDPASGLRLTTAAPWSAKPRTTLNLAFTFEGLRACGVPESSLSLFSQEFQDGAVGNAAAIYDVGTSAPDRWVGNLRARDQVHMLCSLFATTDDDLERHSAALRVLLGAAFAETYSHDGTSLPNGYVHFGYRDGISQPALEGGPPPAHPYPAALGRNGRSPAGDFLLGYENSFQSSYCPDLARTPLGRDGSFGAFRILRQDVRGFAAYLGQAAPKAGLSEDELAAKFLGRWRNGVPLTLSPNSDAPLPSDRLNQFLYHRTAPGQSRPDPIGRGCPVGSHIRRTNPRDDTVAGGSTQQARLIRRNLPYGPAFDPSAPPDDIERGLVGYFINADFHAQFQFLMSQWVNLDNFTASQPITGRDPLIGANDPVTSAFALAEGKSSPCPVTGFNRFVTTRGSAYVFFPSATALRGLACGGSS